MFKSARRAAVSMVVVSALALAACGEADDEPDDVAADETQDDGDEADDADGEPVETTEIRYSLLLPPDGAVADATEWLFEEVEARTDGALVTEIAYGASLLPGTETLAGVGDGRAEGGYVVPAYHPAEMPLANISMIPDPGTNQEARSRALDRMYRENDDFREEFERHNLVLLAFGPNNPHSMAVTERFDTAAEFQGKQVRVAGYLAPAYEALGAETVFVSTEEVYESLQRGVVDGTSFPFDVQIATGVHEVAPYILDDGVGEWGSSAIVLNLDVWNDLPQEVRDAFDDIRDEYYEELSNQLTIYDERTCETLLADGGEVVVFSDEEKEAVADTVGTAPYDRWLDDAVSAGVDEEVAASVWDEYQQYLEEFTAEASYEPGLEVCAEQGD
jgi:TRAP-type transport system periplasmic protein